LPETKRRGKVAKSDAHNLWERLKKYEMSVLLFAKLPHEQPRRTGFTHGKGETESLWVLS